MVQEVMQGYPHQLYNYKLVIVVLMHMAAANSCEQYHYVCSQSPCSTNQAFYCSWFGVYHCSTSSKHDVSEAALCVFYTLQYQSGKLKPH